MFNYSDRKKIVLFFLPFIVLIYLYQDFPNLFCTISNKLIVINYFITNCTLVIFFQYRIKSISDKNHKEKLRKIGWRVLNLTSILLCMLIVNSSKINLNWNFAQMISVICGLVFLGFSFTFENLKLRKDIFEDETLVWDIRTRNWTIIMGKLKVKNYEHYYMENYPLWI